MYPLFQGSSNPPNLAIGYAPTERVPSRPIRQPNNLQDLLRYAVEAGSGAASNESPSQEPLSDANRGFLLNALNSMMVNVTEELASIMKTLKENHTNNKDACIEALDNLSDYVCSIDYANDFLKMGGLPVVELLLTSSEGELRWRAAETIADIVQNNPFAQKFVVESDIFSLLLNSIELDSCLTVQVKCLYAVSCLVRENDLALKQFIQSDGFSVLLRCMQSKQEKLVIKSCFLIGCLCTDNNAVKEVLLSMGIIDQLCSLIDIEHNPDTEVNEHLCSALASLNQQSPQAVELCQQDPLNLKEKLNYIKEIHAGQEKYHKELEYVDLILKEVFENSTASDEHEDR